MTARPATIEDIPALVDMGRRFHGMGVHKGPFDHDAVAALLDGMIGNPAAVVLMHDHGGIGGVLNPAYCGPAWVMAVELFWWAEKDGLSLLRAFEEWAKEAGASEVRMTTLCAHQRADTILRRKGYEPVEISYTKVI